jgi:asparaginyl-tRNA synthetase
MIVNKGELKMLTPLIREVKTRDFDSEHLVNGWVRTVRSQQAVTFVTINDGSDLSGLQLVIEAGSALKDAADQLSTGCAITACGTWQQSPSRGQAGELVVSTLELVGASDGHYPVQNKRHTFEYLRTIGHLRAKTNTFGAVFRVRSTMAQAIHGFFRQQGFQYIHTPIITANDCEGAGELFRVSASTTGDREFFGQPTGLTVSGQLEAEAFAQALSRVYTFGPTFRAENSNTSRHAAEFWMVEPEMAFSNLDDDIALIETFIRHLITVALSECADDLAFFDQHVSKGLVQRLEQLLATGFTRMTYSESIESLLKSNQTFNFQPAWGCDLQTEHERYLAEKLVGGPVFVTDYPKEIKSFYMRANSDVLTVAAVDLLLPGIGELVGGSQREERLDLLAEKMAAAGIVESALSWYLDTRRWGSTQHAGFGLGFERFLMLVTGMENIRDVIPCPRTPGLFGF